MKKSLLFLAVMLLAVSLLCACSDANKIIFEKLESESSEASNATSGESKPEIRFTAEVASEAFLSSTKDYHSFAIEDAEYPQLLYKIGKTVTNFEMFELINIEGGALQKGNVLYTLEKLSPEKPLVAETALDGSIPKTAVAFTDADGNIYVYSVTQSGGNIKLNAIELDADESSVAESSDTSSN